MYIVRIGVLDDMLMAQELSMAHVLSEVAKTDPKLRGAIEKGFEDAILDAEVLAMKEGKTERGQRSSHVLAIIEHIRDITLGNSKRAREAKAADIKEVARAAEERKREELQRDAADKAERALVWCDMEDGTRRAPATLSGKLAEMVIRRSPEGQVVEMVVSISLVSGFNELEAAANDAQSFAERIGAKPLR